MGLKKHGHAKRGKVTSEYSCWATMITRCTSKNSKDYKYYGGRGIVVCDRWKHSENFLADMGPKPGPEYSIDRVNNNGNYCPTNCKWVTKKEQGRNTRKMKWFRASNKELNIIRYSNHQTEFAEEWNLNRPHISCCLHGIRKQHKGWTFKYYSE